ncbi:hypothetical protein N305_08940 [Manacus vitellinus]|uniref:Uncharacterized protein n=1 Tax=Manacus vitellinus TaxID=328815 RepID=A0A093PGD8_9PASS|nr:hypothetical protein N305_08940 [Manacus vitellinus]
MCLQLSSRRYLGIVKPQQLSLARSPLSRRSQFFSSMRLSLQRQRVLIAEGLAEEPHGKSRVACTEFPAWRQQCVYLSTCHTRPSGAPSPTPSGARDKRLARGNEARADLHPLGHTPTVLPPAATGSIAPWLFLPWKTGVIILITYFRGRCEFS